MFHYLKFFAMIPLATLVCSTIFLGGHWMWLGFALELILVIGGDAAFGRDISRPQYKRIWPLQIPLYAALPGLLFMLASLAWAVSAPGTDFLGIGTLMNPLYPFDIFEARAASTWFDELGAIVTVGFMVGGWGIVVGHELTHRTHSPIAMTVGRWLLAMAANADFAIEHVYGHHLNLGTKRDPATARKGETVYRFIVRSWTQGHASAWHLEKGRLRKRNLPLISWHNRMLSGYLMTAILAAAFYVAAGWIGVVAFAIQAAFAKALLEIVNYMEHYGIVRDPKETVKPHHSWNSTHRVSSMVLFSLNRHSHHHAQGNLPYWILEPVDEAPQMPFGYLTTIVICLVPPVWFRMMEQPLAEWEKRYGLADTV